MLRSNAAFLAVLLLSSPALAQNAWDPPSHEGFRRPDGWPRAPRSGASVEIGFWTAGREIPLLGTEERLTSVSGLARAGLVIAEVFEIGVIGGWAWGSWALDPFSDEAATAANPLVSGTFIASDDRYRLRVGAGVTIPAAPNDAQARYAGFYGAASRGLSELWLWAPARLSIVPSFSFEAVPANFFYVDAGVQLAVMIPVEDDFAAVVDGSEDPGEVDFVIQPFATLGFRHDAVLVAARFRTVFLPTLRGENDQAQMSLEPFVRLTGTIDTSASLLFGEIRLMMNLDDELGFAFDELRCDPSFATQRCRGVWGVFLAFGGGA
jgi:hypothetical protein